MPRRRSFVKRYPCLDGGASGADMWMQERAKPINEERVREAAATGGDTLAVACPACTVMLDDGVQSAGGALRVADVAMLLAEALRPAAATRRGPAGRPSPCAGWASHSPRVADRAWLNVLPRLPKSTSIAGLDLGHVDK
jgi:hypothetical protein